MSRFGARIIWNTFINTDEGWSLTYTDREYIGGLRVQSDSDMTLVVGVELLCDWSLLVKDYVIDVRFMNN